MIENFPVTDGLVRAVAASEDGSTIYIGGDFNDAGTATVTGQLVAELVNRFESAGEHSVVFNASSLASGTYIYKIQAGSFIQTRKLMLIK